MRPADLSNDPERFPHGTRARYVLRCRCDDCRAANTQYARDCAARAKLRAAEVVASQPITVTKSHGELVRSYKRACIGINGEPCPTSSYLRKDSTGDICAKCRVRRSFNGLVSAERAREHILALSHAGVGKDAVHAASDVGLTIIDEVRAGRKLRIRAETEARILGVDAAAIADHALVSAAKTWWYLRQLIALGFRRGNLAQRLGSKVPALQIRRGMVLAKTELRVRRLYEQLIAGEHESDERDDVPMPELYESPRWRILRAIRFFDWVCSQDLFDAMEVATEHRNAYTVTLKRLVEAGELEKSRARVNGAFEYRKAVS